MIKSETGSSTSVKPSKAYLKKIKELEMSIDSEKDRMKLTNNENDKVVKKLKSELAKMHSEKHSDILKMKESWESTLTSKSMSYESEISKLKCELAQNIQ